MALTFIPNSPPSYLALSTDISGSKIAGANNIGATVYVYDIRKTYIILEDLTLSEIPDVFNHLADLDKERAYNYAGVRTQPSYSTSDSSIIIGTGTYGLFPDSSGSSPLEIFELPGGTFELADSITTYIYAKYNSGSPIVAKTLNRLDLVSTNLTDAIPIYTCYRYGSIINVLDWDELGLALPEKLLLRCVDTDRFHRTSGLQLSEYGTRNVSISEGIVWYGASKLTVQNFSSGSAPSYMYLLISGSSGIFTGSPITQYVNNAYQGASGSAALTGGKYAVNWVYRFVSDDKRYAGIVLGTGDYNHNQALESQPPALLPNIVQTQGILVGKIIIQNGGSTAEHIDSAFDILFTPTDLDHNLLYDLDGGTTGEYYHLTLAEHNKISGSTRSAEFGDGVNYTRFENDGTLIMSGSATTWKDLFFPLISAKQGQTDKPPFDANEQAYLFPSADTSNIMYISAQFNHDWQIGSAVFPHVHWNQNHSGSPVFKMDYKWFDIGGTIPANYSTYTMDSREYLYTSGSTHQLNYNPVGISGSHISGVSSLMLIKLYRDDNAYTGNAITYQFDIHYPIDSLGSRTEYSK